MNTKKTTRTRKATCSIYHEDNKVILELEMPGVGRENLDINIDNNTLKIHGTRSPRRDEEKNKRYLIREIMNDDYYQEYTIDETIDQEKVFASVRQGLVRIELTMKESVLPKKIDIA